MIQDIKSVRSGQVMLVISSQQNHPLFVYPFLSYSRDHTKIAFRVAITYP